MSTFQREMRCSGHDGLTALDLLITLLIAALLLLTGIPAIKAISMNVQMKSALAGLHSSLSLARAEAINRNAQIVVCPTPGTKVCGTDGEWHHGWLVFQDSNGDRDYQLEEPLLREEPGIRNIRILGSRHRVRLRFFPNGTAPGSNASLSFCDRRGADSAMQLKLSPSGRIRNLSPPEANGEACEA